MSELEEKYAIICAFGPLSFARFHPWVRHITIVHTLRKDKNDILFQFFGACTEFEFFVSRPTEPTSQSYTALGGGKEQFEKFLIEIFMQSHCLNRFNIFKDWTIGKCTSIDATRNAVYLDYKFAKAASMALPIVSINHDSDTEEKNQPPKKRSKNNS